MKFQEYVPTIVWFYINYVFVISSYVCTYTCKLIYVY